MSLAVYEILEAVGHFRVKIVVSLATGFLNQSDLYAVGYGFIASGKVALGALRPGLGDYTASACSVELIGHRVSSPSAIGSSRHRRLSGGLCREVIISFHLRFCPQQAEALGVQRRVSKKRVGSSFHRRWIGGFPWSRKHAFRGL